jgi:hypothetical protein
VTLREQVATDLPTFLNVDEFGESIEVDGLPVTCVLDGAGDTEAPQDGVFNRDELMYVRASEFDVVPVVGQRLTIDDEQADVIAVSEDQGMLVIRLRWFDS